MEKERLSWLDVLKGIGIILVVWDIFILIL